MLASGLKKNGPQKAVPVTLNALIYCPVYSFPPPIGQYGKKLCSRGSRGPVCRLHSWAGFMMAIVTGLPSTGRSSIWSMKGNSEPSEVDGFTILLI